ncbi:MAG: hypothetical protein COA94_02325 [Rickettsiales bacterium]|nr:MAG: hypothetical protein COA94_02325 [Rickettsiales bacterium]
MNVSKLGIVNLVLIVLIIVFVVTSSSMFLSHKNSVQNYGIAFKIQEGVTTGTTDSMVTGGNNMYIANSTDPLTLTLTGNNDHLEGRTVGIKNNTDNNVTLKGQINGITLDDGGLTLIVEKYKTAMFISKDRKGTYLRTQ